MAKSKAISSHLSKVVPHAGLTASDDGPNLNGPVRQNTQQKNFVEVEMGKANYQTGDSSLQDVSTVHITDKSMVTDDDLNKTQVEYESKNE